MAVVAQLFIRHGNVLAKPSPIGQTVEWGAWGIAFGFCLVAAILGYAFSSTAGMSSPMRSKVEIIQSTHPTLPSLLLDLDRDEFCTPSI